MRAASLNSSAGRAFMLSIPNRSSGYRAGCTGRTGPSRAGRLCPGRCPAGRRPKLAAESRRSHPATRPRPAGRLRQRPACGYRRRATPRVIPASRLPTQAFCHVLLNYFQCLFPWPTSLRSMLPSYKGKWATDQAFHLYPNFRTHLRRTYVDTNSMVACILGTTRAALSCDSARVTESFPMGDGTGRVDLVWEIARNQLAVATFTSIQVNAVVRMADGPNTLATFSLDCVRRWHSWRAASHRRRGLLKTQGHLWGAAGAAPFRLGLVTLGLLLSMLSICSAVVTAFSAARCLAAIGPATALLSSCCTWNKSGE